VSRPAQIPCHLGIGCVALEDGLSVLVRRRPEQQTPCLDDRRSRHRGRGPLSSRE
jgi:hypothetical protein